MDLILTHEPEHAIRKATAGDLETLVGFAVREARETEGASPDPDAVRRGVEAGLNGSAPVEYWVAQSSDGAVVGAISVVTEWSNFRGGEYWWIQSLYISREHRGTGLVDRLLEFIADQARANEALDLRLYVLRSNERAVAAYRRCGFEVAPYPIMSRSLS